MTQSIAPNRDLSLLHPVVREKVQAILAQMKKEGIPFEVFEAYRTPQRQAHLYAKGRPNNGPKVTWAKPWTSIHQYGMAVDFVLKINGNWSWDDRGDRAKFWTRMHEISKEQGMTPLFNSKGQLIEKPHVQLVGIQSSNLKNGIYPEGGDAEWADNLSAMIDGWSGLPSAPPKPKVAVRPGLDEDLIADLEDEGEEVLLGSAGVDSLAGSEADARFKKLHTFIKRAEGGFVDHPDDDGGVTNFGITHKTLSDWRGTPVTAEDVKNLTQAEADEILRTNYYARCRCGEMPERMAMVVYNSAVMSGPKKAITLLQEAFNELGMTADGEPLEVDGILGRFTMTAVRETDASVLSETYADLYEAYLQGRHNFDTFGRGWMNRMAKLREFLTTLPLGAGKRPKTIMKIAERRFDIDLDDVLRIAMAGATGGKSAVAGAILREVLKKKREDASDSAGSAFIAAVLENKLDDLEKKTGSKPGNEELTPVNAALGQGLGKLLDGRKSVIGIVGLIAASIIPQLGLTAPDAPQLTALMDGDNQTIIFTLLTIFTGWGFLGKIDKAIREIRTR